VRKESAGKSEDQSFTAGKVVQTGHELLHKIKLLGSGAVTGIKNCAGLVQESGVCFQGVIQGKLGKMEASHQHLGLEPLHNIQDPFVGAAADEYPLSLFLNEQILFMPEIVRKKLFLFFCIQAGTAQVIVSAFIITGIECETFADWGDISGEAQPGMGLKFFIQTNVFFSSVIVGFKGMAVQVYGSFFVNLQKGLQSSAVVIMTVREDGKIYSSQVNIQFSGIFSKESGLSHVKEQFVIKGFDIEGQPVFCSKILPAGSVFSQRDNAHDSVASFQVQGLRLMKNENLFG